MNNAIAVKPVNQSLLSVGLDHHNNTSTLLLKTDSASPDVQIIKVKASKSISLDTVLGKVHVDKFAVKGDSSCLYHAISHQAGLISTSS